MELQRARVKAGIFSANIEIAKPTAKPVFTTVQRVLVDTGSEATWILVLQR
jgi:hypothetical protein